VEEFKNEIKIYFIFLAIGGWFLFAYTMQLKFLVFRLKRLGFVNKTKTLPFDSKFLAKRFGITHQLFYDDNTSWFSTRADNPGNKTFTHKLSSFLISERCNGYIIFLDNVKGAYSYISEPYSDDSTLTSIGSFQRKRSKYLVIEQNIQAELKNLLNRLSLTFPKIALEFKNSCLIIIDDSFSYNSSSDVTQRVKLLSKLKDRMNEISKNHS
jgi:hypothetical protein